MYILEVRDANFTKHPVYTRSFLVYTWHHEMLCKRKVLEVGFINSQREVYQTGTRLSFVSHITSFHEFHVNLSISREARFSRADSETSFHQFSRLTCPGSAALMNRKGPPLERRSVRSIRDRDSEFRTDAKIHRNDVEFLLTFHFQGINTSCDKTRDARYIKNYICIYVYVCVNLFLTTWKSLSFSIIL